MLDDKAFGLLATNARRARIDAMPIDARLRERTLIVGGAFGSTVGRRADVIGKARANRLVIVIGTALRVGSAW